MGRKKIIEDGKRHAKEEGRENRRRMNEATERLKDTTITRAERRNLEQQLEILTRDRERLRGVFEVFNDLGQRHDEKVQRQQREFEITQEQTRRLEEVAREGQAELGGLVLEAANDVYANTERTRTLLVDYIASYKSDQANLYIAAAGLIIGLAGFAAGVAGLAIAVKALPPPDKPTPSGTTPENPSGTTPANALRAPELALDAEPLGAADEDVEIPDIPPADEPPEEIERLVMSLAVSKELVSRDAVPQKELWTNLARGTESHELEAHGYTLAFIQEAAAARQETRVFSWAAASDLRDACKSLYDAYLAHEKIGDAYLAAAELTYDGKPVPLFHAAFLLQTTRALIDHHRKFPDADVFASR